MTLSSGRRSGIAYGMSCQELEEVLSERGVQANHTTIYRWVQYMHPSCKVAAIVLAPPDGYSWRIDEIYVKINGKWVHVR